MIWFLLELDLLFTDFLLPALSSFELKLFMLS